MSHALCSYRDILRHKGTATVRDHITSIDEVERRSGLTVFSELPEVVEKALASEKGSRPTR